MVALFLACTVPSGSTVSGGANELDAVALLNRASLDLRAIRPSQAEIATVEADPDALEGLVDGYVASDAFPERLVALYSEVFRTRADRYLTSLDNDVDFIDPSKALAFKHAVGEEPLRLVADIAANDLPYTDLVTADYTMANDAMIEHFGLTPLQEEGPKWRRARYVDSRPAVGVLATSGMWWRYTSTKENANRGRAAAIGLTLLCDERFSAAVSFQGDTVNLEDRVRTDPSCVGCHATLDPLGSYLWGFMWLNQEAWLEVTRYKPSGELDWEHYSGVAPAFYGMPGDTLYELGRQVAADPRYVDCAVETGMKFMLNRHLGVDDSPYLQAHREDFLDGGLTLRALYRSLVNDPRYREADSDDAEGSPLRSMRPDQLAGSLEALTGYRWTWEGNDMLDTDEQGVRILAGGADGVIATDPAVDPSTTTALVQERVAEAAADAAVQRERLMEPADRTLFKDVDFDAEPDRDSTVSQVQRLLETAHGKRYDVEGDEVTALAELFDALYAESGDSAVAWTLTLSGVFRHPDFLLY